MAEATFTIAAVTTKKRGQTDGRAWTLYEVRAQEGGTYTTFDAAWQRHVGARVTVPISATNGMSARLGRFPNGHGPAGEEPASAASAPAAPDRFPVLDSKLDRLLAEVAAIRRHFT